MRPSSWSHRTARPTPRSLRCDRLPRDVAWAVWDGMDGPIVEREPVSMDSQFAVHRYLRLAEKTVVGFRWDW